jgi:hypothetical protein
MRFIKKINELFDDGSLKLSHEIPYMSGDLTPISILSNSRIYKFDDGLVRKLSMDCPYVNYLSYNRVGNLLVVGYYKESQNSDNEESVISFTIEISQHNGTDSFICNTYARCMVNGKKIYNESIIRSIMSYDNLKDLLNNSILDLLIDFSKIMVKKFNVNIIPSYDKKTLLNKSYFN